MADTEKHQGWTNYVTWCVKLHIGNEQGAQKQARHLAQLALADAPGCSQVADKTWTIEQAARYHLSEALKEWIEDGVMADSGSSFRDLLKTDLLTRALGEVNWDEIAKAYLEDVEAPT